MPAILLVLVGAWALARHESSLPPAEEASPADGEAPAVIAADGTEVTWSCVGSQWDEGWSRSWLALEGARTGWVDACMRAYLVTSDAGGDGDAGAAGGDTYRIAVTAYWTTRGGYAVAPWQSVDAVPAGPVTVEITSGADGVASSLMTAGFSVQPCGEGETAQRTWLEGWDLLLTDGCPGPLPDVVSEEGVDVDRAYWVVDRPSDADITVHTWQVTLPAGQEPRLSLQLSSPAGYTRAGEPAEGATS
ncbi:hypothetical protein RN607_08120 [Demequina capsici]|uniref:Uncharacterized protein n=1 Tax=Demequina capsici TaxID=3075620 RepID=A0AA96F3H2_9MICO|nr:MULTISPECIES: hypothetical protein [unclassified Demequina]WNM23286.1 hypothetical protein RN606_07885 [Demequina sp. OYTSA14]WNM26164.1 hypothetical protein RN607_08120 [Demequina sp. PMTSA13]